MPNAFRSSGTIQGTEFSVEQVLHRTSRSKTSAVAKVMHKERHNYIDDIEIGVQEQHTTALEFGVSHRQYSRNTIHDVYVFYRQGIKGLAAKKPSVVTLAIIYKVNGHCPLGPNTLRPMWVSMWGMYGDHPQMLN